MKKLVLVTAFFALLLLLGGTAYTYFFSPPPQLKRGNPILGSPQAPIGIILVEDLRCGFCRRFSLDLLPQIQERYLDTGKAYCIFVPVAFLSGSKPLANAALAVHQLAPDRFMPYVHALFAQFAEKDDLIPIAEQIGGINLDELRKCIETECFSSQLEGNLAWAKQLMGPGFGVPALFINGVRTPTGSLEEIEKELQK